MSGTSIPPQNARRMSQRDNARGNIGTGNGTSVGTSVGGSILYSDGNTASSLTSTGTSVKHEMNSTARSFTKNGKKHADGRKVSNSSNISGLGGNEEGKDTGRGMLMRPPQSTVSNNVYPYSPHMNAIQTPLKLCTTSNDLEEGDSFEKDLCRNQSNSSLRLLSDTVGMLSTDSLDRMALCTSSRPPSSFSGTFRIGSASPFSLTINSPNYDDSVIISPDQISSWMNQSNSSVTSVNLTLSNTVPSSSTPMFHGTELTGINVGSTDNNSINESNKSNNGIMLDEVKTGGILSQQRPVKNSITDK